MFVKNKTLYINIKRKTLVQSNQKLKHNYTKYTIMYHNANLQKNINLL